MNGADLSETILICGKLNSVVLTRACLQDADLRFIEGSSINLSWANLNSTWLMGAGLNSANLKNASIYQANLNKINLSNANLTGANLAETDLTQANLTSVVHHSKMPNSKKLNFEEQI